MPPEVESWCNLESLDKNAHLSATEHKLGVIILSPLIVSFKHIITMLPDNCKCAR